MDLPELTTAIVAKGEEIRQLKGAKAAKEAIDKAVAELLDLKERYKVANNGTPYDPPKVEAPKKEKAAPAPAPVREGPSKKELNKQARKEKRSGGGGADEEVAVGAATALPTPPAVAATAASVAAAPAPAPAKAAAAASSNTPPTVFFSSAFAPELARTVSTLLDSRLIFTSQADGFPIPHLYCGLATSDVAAGLTPLSPSDSLPRVSAESWLTATLQEQVAGAAVLVVYDPMDWTPPPSAGASQTAGADASLIMASLAPGMAVQVVYSELQADGRFTERTERQVIPAGMRLLPLQFGPPLRAHSSGRHVLLRASYVLGAAAVCTGAEPLPVTQRLFNRTLAQANVQYTRATDAAPQVLPRPRDCDAVIAAVCGASALLYVRPGTLANVTCDIARMLAQQRDSALRVFPASRAVLDTYAHCEGEVTTALPNISVALPIDVIMRMHLDVQHPHMNVPVQLVGAMLLNLRVDAWDRATFAHALPCLLDEHCVAPRASIQVHAALRGDAFVRAAVVRSANIWALRRADLTVLHGLYPEPVRVLPALPRCGISTAGARGVNDSLGMDAVQPYLQATVVLCDDSVVSVTATHGSTPVAASAWEAARTVDGPACKDIRDDEFIHRRWNPRWSSYRPDEARMLASEAWGSTNRLRMAHCVQSQHADSSPRLLPEILASSAPSFVVVGCWQKPCDQLADRVDVVVNMPGVSWTYGRNQLLAIVRDAELQQGYLFEYVGMYDEDLILFGACDKRPTAELMSGKTFGPAVDITVALQSDPKPGTCIDSIDAWLHAMMPPYASPTYFYEATDLIVPLWVLEGWSDASCTYFHRRAMDVLLPYDVYFEQGSAWASQAILVMQARVFLANRVVLGLVRNRNPEHRPYTDRPPGADNAATCDWVRTYVRDEEVVAASLVPFAVWGGCALPWWQYEKYIGEAREWGTLSWLRTAGRYGPPLAVEHHPIATGQGELLPV